MSMVNNRTLSVSCGHNGRVTLAQALKNGTRPLSPHDTELTQTHLGTEAACVPCALFATMRVMSH